MNNTKLLLKSIAGFLFLFAVLSTVLFLTAGTIHYCLGWLCLAALFIPSSIITIHIFRNDKKLLESRLSVGPTSEVRPIQKIIQGVAGLLFVGLYLLSALDYRYGWSGVPVWFSYLSDGMIVTGMSFVGWVFHVNSYLSAIIEVQDKQKVIDSGPYAIVRHPMYLAASVMLLFTPPALGSWWGILISLLLVFAIALRALDEEKYLKTSLDGYEDYCKKVKYRIIPFVW
ncbi:MAG: isoprenylcysteine carboxylmethyltransferase family protein [Tannerella sp.]|jgi:protein-S-isoprenylcysteine O-methyltransferase Ste14|nr:isoprenylcysteine carboxylmethyltransferase family protein [Tannerella sp.]